MPGILDRLRGVLGGGGGKRRRDVGPVFGESGDSFNKGRLQDRMARAAPEMQRRVLVTACEFAVAGSGLDHPLAQEALAAVREGRSLPRDRREQLQGLADELDARHDELDEGGQASEDELKLLFWRARAASALYSATRADPVRDAYSTVYEAWFASDGPKALPPRIEELLR
jgi:hypothetical protein